MKEKELRKCAVCALCKEKILKSGVPFFYRVRIERHGIKLDAVQRQTGLAMMLGHSGLANIMGPDEDMTMPVMDPIEFTVCENCSTDLEQSHCIARFAETQVPA